MSAWSEAFAEVKAAVRPDDEPTLTSGDGVTPAETEELDQVILASARGTTWTANATVNYGDTVFPATRMGRRFKVTRGGTLGATEPTWPDSEYATVTSGTATLVEDGADFDSIYDLRQAKYEGLNRKVLKAITRNRFVSNGQGQANDYTYLNLVKERDRYRAVGVA